MVKPEKDIEFDELIKKGKKMDKIEFLRLVFLSGCDVGKRQRNTEVKQAIESQEIFNLLVKCMTDENGDVIADRFENSSRIQIELLQKLGLGKE